jgi:hypothetical protein
MKTKWMRQDSGKRLHWIDADPAADPEVQARVREMIAQKLDIIDPAYLEKFATPGALITIRTVLIAVSGWLRSSQVEEPK